MPGVVRTRVGYCGGRKVNPTYSDLGDHTETIEIDFDPKKITYEKLLEVFWNHHNPCSQPFSQQYKCAVFFNNDEQQATALKTREAIADKLPNKVFTEIIPANKFYLAEDYHQKYELRYNKQILAEFKAMYPRDIDLVNSTAAARVNAYIRGHGKLADLQTEIESYGLSSESKAKLLAKVRKSQ